MASQKTTAHRSERFVITSAQAAARPNDGVLESLLSYANHHSSHLVVLPMIGQNASEDIDQLDDRFGEFDVFDGNRRRLNNSIDIEEFNVRPYQIDPLTGLQRFCQRDTSKVFASPKQRLQPIPHSNRKHPKFLVTTGAVTHPNYATGYDVSAERRRIGNIARRDHVYGAVIVELDGSDLFHLRHVRATAKGDFVDLGMRYGADGSVTESKLEAMVLGDYHNGKTDPQVREATHKMIREYKPGIMILHDFFDGHSISYHIDKDLVSQSILQRLDLGHASLDVEFQQAYDELMVLHKLNEERPIVIVPANHPEFVNRWIDEGRFVKEPLNARMGFKLADYMARKDYNNPVEAGIRMMGKVPRNVRFLRRDEDYKIRGYQLAAHGDKGPDGGRGTMTSKENDFGKSISGHVHKAQILRDTITVGTMLPLNMFYMRGQPSAWTHSHALIYETGTVQVLNILDGKWRASK